VKQPAFISFVGVDLNTDLDELKKISDRWPGKTMWGILYHESPSSRKYPNRYPPLSVTRDLFDKKVQIAAHLCGQTVKGFTDQRGSRIPFLAYDLIQLNALQYDMGAVISSANVYKIPIVLQHRSSTLPETASDLENKIIYLHDKSGGKGIVSSANSRPESLSPSWLIGYSGGITPENAAQVNEEVPDGFYYLDMESGVRTEDWFDLKKCRAVMEAVYGFQISVEERESRHS